jgi:type IV secretion system protein VirB6
MDALNIYGLTDALLQTAWASFGSSGLDFGPQANSTLFSKATDMFFFREVKDFIDTRIDRFALGMLSRLMGGLGIAALVIVTMWVFWQGIRILTGKSRESMTEVVMNSARTAIIISVATGFAASGAPIHKFLADKTMYNIYGVVTGKEMQRDAKDRIAGPYEDIDNSLTYMQLAMVSIDAIDTSGNESIETAKSRAQLWTGIGIAGPSMVGGTLLILNRIMMALFIGFGPIFIMCLLFDQTKNLFTKWLMYGIGTMFSLAVLSVMVGIALDITIAVAIAFWTGQFLGGNDGITSMALQQGGLGTILTLLMITVPPMAANFFQGTLGQLSTINMFGGSGATAAQARQQRVDQASVNTGGQSSLTAPPGSDKPSGSQSVGNRGPDTPAHAVNPAASSRTSNPSNPDITKTERGRELMDSQPSLTVAKSTNGAFGASQSSDSADKRR